MKPISEISEISVAGAGKNIVLCVRYISYCLKLNCDTSRELGESYFRIRRSFECRARQRERRESEREGEREREKKKRERETGKWHFKIRM